MQKIEFCIYMPEKLLTNLLRYTIESNLFKSKNILRKFDHSNSVANKISNHTSVFTE